MALLSEYSILWGMLRYLSFLFCFLSHCCHIAPDALNDLNSVKPSFRSLSQSIVDQFHSLSWSEKVPYIFTETEWDELVQEYHHISPAPRIGYEEFLEHFTEFNNVNDVVKFWTGCDMNKDRHVDVQEYVFCRGDFDQNGHQYDMNEYELREANLLAHFEPSFVFDEDGIIID